MPIKKKTLWLKKNDVFFFCFDESLETKQIVLNLQVFILVEFKVFNFALIQSGHLSTVLLELNVLEN